MNLTNSELDTLYELVENKHYKLMHDSAFGDWEAVKEEVCELHLIRHKLLKLQEKTAFIHRSTSLQALLEQGLSKTKRRGLEERAEARTYVDDERIDERITEILVKAGFTIKSPEVFKVLAAMVKRSDKFETPTAIASKLLHVKEGDLRALRKCGELKRGHHYETGITPNPATIFYNLETSCEQLHGVTWKEFTKPGFDVEANRERQVEKAFAKAREGIKR